MHHLPDLTTDTSRLSATTAEVNLDHLRHNARLLQAKAGSAGFMAVVKADAYGHGAVAVARALQLLGIHRFAVATLPEAVRLREAGIEGSLLVFAPPRPGTFAVYAAHDLELSVPSREVAEAVADAARAHGPLRVHVKVDTGMHRLGLLPDAFVPVVRLLEKAPGVTLAGLWTHLATSDAPDLDFAYAQLDAFDAAVAPVRDAAETLHVANSAALLRLPESYAFDRALVRIGIALYGLFDPDGLADLDSSPEAAGLRPILRLTSRVAQVKTLAAGETVSYGRRWTAATPTRIATVAAGYADGYFRSLSNRAEVGLGGRRYPIAGTVCMDMFMVDLGPPDGPGAEVQAGDEAVLFGDGGPTTLEVARWADTIPYEVSCRIAARVPRVYAGTHE